MNDNFWKALDQAPNPSYVLDEVSLVRNLTKLKSLQSLTACFVLCALKGFSMWSTFPLLKQYLAGATASSLNEVKLINDEFGQKAHACFVVYLANEFVEVLENSSHITFNSLSQYRKFKSYIIQYPNVKFGIRIDPGVSGSTVEKYNPCMPGGRFGVQVEEIQEGLPEGITGVHFHALCENDASDLELVLENVESNFGHCLHEASWVNMGGGHHITKKGYNFELLVDLINSFKQNYKVEVTLEPGEAIGWETGVLKARVEDLLHKDEVHTATLNVSFCAHMPDCLEMPYKPNVYNEIDPINEGENVTTYTFGGNTCMSGDFVSGFTFAQPLKEGETVVFMDMMHYTFVKSTTFNGVPLPAISVVSKEGKLTILKEFGYLNFKGRLS